jgi:hypothetical protein
MHRLLSLVAPPPLSPRCRHYCRANACLIAPLSRQRLVVASSPLLLHQCLSCRADASLVAPPPLLLPCGLWRLDIVDVPPAYNVRSFCTTLLPPPLLFARGPVKGGGVASPLSFNLTLSSSLSSLSFRALTYYVVAIATSLDAPSPLARCATASIAMLPPLLPRQRLSHCASLAPTVGCCIVTSLAAPVPLLSCRRLSRCSATSLVAPPPLSLWCLTCAGWLSLHQLS